MSNEKTILKAIKNLSNEECREALANIVDSIREGVGTVDDVFGFINETLSDWGVNLEPYTQEESDAIYEEEYGIQLSGGGPGSCVGCNNCNCK